MHPTQISAWKKQAMGQVIDGFSSVKPGLKRQDDDSTVEGLYAKIGRLEIENDFLKKVLSDSLVYRSGEARSCRVGVK